MMARRKIEIFSAGCAICDEAVERVRKLACSSCEVTVLDMRSIDIVKRAKALDVRSVPAVAINDKLVDCCTGRGVDEQKLRAAGLGVSV